MMGTVVSNESIEGGTNKENVEDETNNTCDNDVVEEDTDDAQGSTCDNTPVLDRQSSFVESWRTKWVEAYRVIVGKNKPGQYSLGE